MQKKPLEMAQVSKGLTEEENNARGYKWHVSYPIDTCNYHNVACQVFFIPYDSLRNEPIE
jgi:hypothetical protein